MGLRIGSRNPHTGLTLVITTDTWERVTATDSELADFQREGDIRPYASPSERALAKATAMASTGGAPDLGGAVNEPPAWFKDFIAANNLVPAPITDPSGTASEPASVAPSRVNA